MHCVVFTISSESNKETSGEGGAEPGWPADEGVDQVHAVDVGVVTFSIISFSVVTTAGSSVKEMKTRQKRLITVSYKYTG